MEIRKSPLKYILLLCLLTGIVIASCKKQNVDTTTVNLPVVSAYLIPGQSISVKLYKQKDLTDTAVYGSPITGQQLSLSDGSSTVKLTESAKGTYTYSDLSFLVAGKTYTLTFNYLTFAVSAKTVMPAKPQNFATQYTGITVTSSSSGPNSTLDTLDRMTWSNPDSLNHILVFNNDDGIAFSLNSFGNNSKPNFEVNTNQKSVYYITPNIFPYYGHYHVVLLSVNQEYIDLLKSNTSSANSNNLSNTPTNIVNGYGIFTAMQSDTLKFNVLD
ncbi:DUF4249 family protein [Mucilaginibacter sp.]|uniref:DUF4249 family protein n=1 Tax=Mucilaginibacter sp. TaxID=1882438 RepID=UPI003D104C8A